MSKILTPQGSPVAQPSNRATGPRFLDLIEITTLYDTEETNEMRTIVCELVTLNCDTISRVNPVNKYDLPMGECVITVGGGWYIRCVGSIDTVRYLLHTPYVVGVDIPAVAAKLLELEGQKFGFDIKYTLALSATLKAYALAGTKGPAIQ